MVGQAEEDRVVEVVDTRVEDRQEERQGVVEVVGDIIEGIQRGWLVDSPGTERQDRNEAGQRAKSGGVSGRWRRRRQHPDPLAWHGRDALLRYRGSA